jgi:hypothetical protein
MNPPKIELVEVFDLPAGALKIFHLCDLADTNCPLQWWISRDGKHHALFDQEAYYDSTLRQRHETGNMICPQDKTQPIYQIGLIHRQIDLAPSSYLELSRSVLVLDSVSVNEI